MYVCLSPKQAVQPAIDVEIQFDAFPGEFRPLLDLSKASCAVELNEATVFQEVSNALEHLVDSVLEPLVDLFDDGALLVQIEHDAHDHGLAVDATGEHVRLRTVVLNRPLAVRGVLE